MADQNRIHEWPDGLAPEWYTALRDRYGNADAARAATNDDLLGLPGATHGTVAMIRAAFATTGDVGPGNLFTGFTAPIPPLSVEMLTPALEPRTAVSTNPSHTELGPVGQANSFIARAADVTPDTEMVEVTFMLYGRKCWTRFSHIANALAWVGELAKRQPQNGEFSITVVAPPNPSGASLPPSARG